MIEDETYEKDEDWHCLVPMDICSSNALLKEEVWYPVLPIQDVENNVTIWPPLVPLKNNKDGECEENIRYPLVPLPDENHYHLKIHQLNLEIDKLDRINIEQIDEIFHLRRKMKLFENENRYLKEENECLQVDGDLSFELKQYYKGLVMNDNKNLDSSLEDREIMPKEAEVGELGKHELITVPTKEIPKRGSERKTRESISNREGKDRT